MGDSSLLSSCEPPKNQTQLVGLGGNHLYSLSHLTSSIVCLVGFCIKMKLKRRKNGDMCSSSIKMGER